MKKSIVALLLVGSLLLPACDSFSSESKKEHFGGHSQEESSSDNDSSTGGNTGTGGNVGNTGDGACAHVDGDDNGYCDSCTTSVSVTFNFFALNDLHGKFEDTSAQAGVDELTTYIKQAREKNENTVVLSSGDMWQGSPESNATKGAIITEWMNDVAFASMTMGNHEYDWGEEYIRNNAELANFPFLGINVYDTTTNKRVDYCQPSVTVEKNGVKIGIIGAIGDCLSSISGEVLGNIAFKTGSELTSLVKAESQKLRSEGADFIVYSLHGSYKESGEYDVALSGGYVDLVFEGHTHKSYAGTDANSVYHLQNAGDNGGVSYAEISINYVNDTAKVLSAKSLSTSAYTSLSDDPIVDTLMQKYDEQISVVNRTLGQNDKVRKQDELLSLCAQLYFEAGYERWGKYYDIFLGGGFMNVRAPYELHAGTVAYGDLMNILPFDNQLVLCSIKGIDLKEKFLSGRDRYYVYCGEYGESMQSSIKDGATYYLITDTYSSTYSYNNLTEVARYDANVFARDLLAAYIEKGRLSTPAIEATIPQIIAIGNALANNAETAEIYRVEGEVVNIESTAYGNLTLRDKAGNELYVYRCYDSSGARYDAMANPPKVGDTIVLEAVVKKFVSNGSVKIELINAVVRG